jgi:hypothetical protein
MSEVTVSVIYQLRRADSWLRAARHCLKEIPTGEPFAELRNTAKSVEWAHNAVTRALEAAEKTVAFRDLADRIERMGGLAWDLQGLLRCVESHADMLADECHERAEEISRAVAHCAEVAECIGKLARDAPTEEVEPDKSAQNGKSAEEAAPEQRPPA